MGEGLTEKEARKRGDNDNDSASDYSDRVDNMDDELINEEINK